MKLSKIDIDNKADQVYVHLISFAGLKNAKKIAMQIRRKLKAEEERRKNL